MHLVALLMLLGAGWITPNILFPLGTRPDVSLSEVLKMENRVNLRFHPIRASFIPKDSLLVLDTWIVFQDTLHLLDVEQALSEFLYFLQKLVDAVPINDILRE